MERGDEEVVRKVGEDALGIVIGQTQIEFEAVNDRERQFAVRGEHEEAQEAIGYVVL